MTFDIIQANDEMLTMLKTAWDAQTTAIVAYIPDIQYEGETKKVVPPSDKYYGVLYNNILTNPQATLCGDLDGIGSRRYNNTGILEFHISCPLSDAENANKGKRLGIVARNAFRGKYSPSGIIFYNARIIPSKPNEIFNKYIMFVDYNYYNIG